MKRFLYIVIAVFILLALLYGVFINQNKASKTLLLATTTSTYDSGLLDDLLPIFEKKTGIEVKVIAVGTGKALQMGRDGEVDVLLVHAPLDEEKFVEEGHGLRRYDVMYNDFVFVSPSPELFYGIETIEKLLAYLRENQVSFVSRGDDSGTHKKEMTLWERAGISPSGKGYVSAGKGMGDVLLMAEELRAVTLTDRGTYLAMKDKLTLKIIAIESEHLLNPYGVIAVNPDKNPYIHAKEAAIFIEWLLSEETQKAIGAFGLDPFGEPLFFPNAAK